MLLLKCYPDAARQDSGTKSLALHLALEHQASDAIVFALLAVFPDAAREPQIVATDVPARANSRHKDAEQRLFLASMLQDKHHTQVYMYVCLRMYI